MLSPAALAHLGLSADQAAAALAPAAFDPMPALTAYIAGCPWAGACRARALREFSDHPELVAMFEARERCRDTDPHTQRACAKRLGLDKEGPC